MIILGVLVVLLLIDVYLFATEKHGWSLVSTIAIAAGAYWFIPEVRAFVDSHNWKDLVLYAIPAYLALGAAVASLKWITFTRGIGKRLAEYRKGFEDRYKEPPATATADEDEFVDQSVDPRLVQSAPKKKEVLTDEQRKLRKRAEFLHQLSHDRSAMYTIFKRSFSLDLPRSKQRNDEYVLNVLTPRTRDYLARVTFWVMQWPIVLIDFVLSDLLIKLGEHIAVLIDTVFSRMARMFVSNAIKGI